MSDKKTVWGYDQRTGVLCSKSTANPDPLQEGEFLIPAYATPNEPIPFKQGEIAVYVDKAGLVPQNWQDGQWVVEENHVGKSVWMKADPATTAQVTELGAIHPDWTLLHPCEFAEWDTLEDKWRVNVEMKREHESIVERLWRDEELSMRLQRRDQYIADQQIPKEYRNSPLTEEQFLKLLGDIKRLCDYPQHENFPDCGRPELEYYPE